MVQRLNALRFGIVVKFPIILSTYFCITKKNYKIIKKSFLLQILNILSSLFNKKKKK